MSVEHRVIGPPGTGKTRYLTDQAERAAEKYGGEAVAAASLTKAAAQEIASRAHTIPRESVGTLHAHAFRGLERPPLAEVPEGLADWNRHVEGLAPTLRVRTGAGLDAALDFAEAGPSSATDGEVLLAELSTERARMSDPATWRGPLRRFDELWGEWKAKAGRLDFTDLIVRAAEELDACPGRPAVMLLDEAQDLSKLEFVLARKWGAQTEQLVVCGDPFQNLYEWRGADPEAFWAGDVASERVLGQSHRLARAVHGYASAWVRQLSTWREIEYLPTEQEGEVRALVEPSMAYPAPDGLLAELHRDLEDGASVMVLASCAYMLEPLAHRLREAGIPYHNPYRPKHGGWNPLRGAGRLLAFLRPSAAVWGDEKRAWTWRDLEQWTDPLEARSTLQRGAKTFVESKCAPGLLGPSEDADRPVAWSAVEQLLLPESLDPAFELDVDWWAGSLRERERRRHAYPVEVVRRRGGAALRGRPQVVLGTIHSVKGGEADSVYVFPDLSPAAAPAPGAIGTPRLPDPVVRLFYVAFTRARRKLTILPAGSRDYAPLPRPGGGTVEARPRGSRLSALVKAQLKEGSDGVEE